DAGWPAAILELTTRAFEVTGPADPAEARLRAARRFLDTMIRARPYELGNAFGWGADGARQAFGALVERGEAVRTGPAFGLGRPADGAGDGPSTADARHSSIVSQLVEDVAVPVARGASARRRGGRAEAAEDGT